jgi:squalene-associated FAD-dependent desaturase
VTTAAVVGAGWSGLACALALQDAGVAVTLFDAAPQTGGRARRVEVDLGDRRYALDNGQHLLIGAYSATLALMQRVGVAPESALIRMPFALSYPDGFCVRAHRLPAPLHLALALVRARGLSVRERLAATRWVLRQRRRDWHVDEDCTAAALFAGEPAVLVERIWEPLCLAALNVRLAQASARVFLAVLRDSVGADRASSDLLLARSDLSRLFPDAAQATLTRQGATVRLRSPVTALRGAKRWHVVLRDESAEFDRVVLALPPERAAALLVSAEASPALSDLIAQLQAIESAPIATVYLRYADGTRLPEPFSALRERPLDGQFGQWVFDRGATESAADGVMAVVISGHGPHLELPRPALAAAVAAQLQAAFALPAPSASAVLVEKRATIVPRPYLRRPPAKLPARGLYLAGDAADSAYPSTIEGSVRAGMQAAHALLKESAL